MNKKDFNTLLKLFKNLLTDERGKGVKELMETLLNSLMLSEREQFLKAKPYERSSNRDGYGNGFKSRKLKTNRFGVLELEHPQVRGGSSVFRSSMFERYQRSEKALFLAAAEMYFKGLSTRKIRALYKDVFSTDISPQFISEASKKIDKSIKQWRDDDIEEEIPYLVVDAIYTKVRFDHSIVSNGVLIVSGVSKSGHRRILDFSVSDLESESTWTDLFKRLKAKGLKGVKYIVSDAHGGIKSAISKSFNGVIWNRCKVHFMRNWRKKITKKKHRAELLALLKSAYNSSSRKNAMAVIEEASGYLKEHGYYKLCEKLPEEFEESIQYFALPREHWRRMSSSNFIERINGEIKRRIYSIRIFPNVSSLERLIGAILMEQDEEWRVGKIYLNTEDLYENFRDLSKFTEIA